MSTSVLRAWPPLLPGVVSWYATPSPPASKRSAAIRPGKAAGDPEYGLEVEADVDGVGADDFGTIVASLTTGPGAPEK